MLAGSNASHKRRDESDAYHSATHPHGSDPRKVREEGNCLRHSTISLETHFYRWSGRFTTSYKLALGLLGMLLGVQGGGDQSSEV